MSTACTVQVAVEVMSEERGLEMVRPGKALESGRVVSKGASSGRARASPMAEMPIPVLVAQSWER